MIADKKESAFARVQLLVEAAAVQPPKYDEIGVWSHADYDEIVLLNKFLDEELSERIAAIFPSSYPSSAYDQRQLAERILRSIKLYEEYGTLVVQKPSNISPDLAPQFSLEEKEKERVLKLSEDMRKIVFSSSIFDEPHKRRLLNRIAAIETEVHQKNGRLDVVLAGVVDVGDALGKFGKKVEPLTKRMKEVADLARSGSRQYDQIPPPEDVPALPAPDEKVHPAF